MTQSQWGEISFEGSYYRKVNDISFKQNENTPQKIFQPIVHYLLGTFNVTLPLDQYCFLPF